MTGETHQQGKPVVFYLPQKGDTAFSYWEKGQWINRFTPLHCEEGGGRNTQRVKKKKKTLFHAKKGGPSDAGADACVPPECAGRRREKEKKAADFGFSSTRKADVTANRTVKGEQKSIWSADRKGVHRRRKDLIGSVAKRGGRKLTTGALSLGQEIPQGGGNRLGRPNEKSDRGAAVQKRREIG